MVSFLQSFLALNKVTLGVLLAVWRAPPRALLPSHCRFCLPESGGPFIDQVYVLQSYAEGWAEGAWEEKVDGRPCIDPPLYSQDKHEYYRCARAPARRPPGRCRDAGTCAHVLTAFGRGPGDGGLVSLTTCYLRGPPWGRAVTSAALTPRVTQTPRFRDCHRHSLALKLGCVHPCTARVLPGAAVVSSDRMGFVVVSLQSSQDSHSL